MRFFIFVIIVFGVFLLALSNEHEEPTVGFMDRLIGKSPSRIVTRTESVSAMEEKLAEAETEVSNEVGKPPITTIETASEPAYEGLPADAVLTKGEKYSREQLENFANKDSVNMQTPVAPEPMNHRENMQDIHAVNRNALTTLARVDAVLHGKKRGDKQ